MLRTAVTICFALTLLCPVICLADTGDECSEHSQPMSRNCEAMSFGAVIEKVDSCISSLHDFVLCLDTLSLSKIVADRSRDRTRLAHEHPLRAKLPPDASRRHALLQTFLF